MRFSLAVAPVLAFALACALGLGVVSAAEDFVVLHDWAHGHSAVGVTTLAPAPPAPVVETLRFDVDACHPRLLMDLLYDPGELAVDAEGVGEAALAYRFTAQVWQAGELVAEREIASPGYGYPVALLPGEGETEVRFWLADGAAVSWDARVRGRLAIDDPACQDPL